MNRIAHSTLLTILRRGFKFSCINHELKPILMASLSPTMDKGNIVNWNFKEGDLIEAGSTMCEIETDKAVVGYDSIDDVILAKIVKPDGSKDISIGDLIGWTIDKGDDISTIIIPDHVDGQSGETQSADLPAESAESLALPSTNDEQQSANSDAHVEKGRFKASPAVRALISKHNINPALLKATGPRGTITKSDVDEYLSKIPSSQAFTPKSSDFTDMPISTVRGIVASRLALSKRTIPHEYCSVDCITNNVIKIRSQLKERGVKVSVNDFILKATALSLKLVPEMNGIFEKDMAVLKPDIDIAVAVSIPDGLITPVLRHADSLSLSQISSIVKDLAGRARDRKLAPPEFQGSSFTVSNLGMYGIDSFSAVINPPELAILAIGSSRSFICVERSALRWRLNSFGILKDLLKIHRC
ncbi:hypothetical protein GJ496_005269 [Pomphorhynchus laevis]|nr:hypothetical protein GJ496_005269 [Pomphorhynchus laevis]